MTFSSKSNKITNAISNAGKATLKGAGVFAVATITVLAEASDIKRRDDIRTQLSVISDYDLAIALEIIQDRIDKK